MEEEPWYRIVGMVPDLGMGHEPEGVYHPTAAGAAASLYVAARVRGDPEALIPRLRDLAATVDPTLRLHEVLPLDRVNADALLGFTIGLVLLVSAVALLLSLAGIYAVMAFTVAKRTREIGIRVALGADPRRIVAAIFGRPLRQVGIGILAGAAIVSAMPLAIYMETYSPRLFALIVTYSAGMMAVCLLACVVPTRRALGIEPMDALREE